MTTARPGYVWDGAAWVPIGSQFTDAPISLQSTEPSSPQTGDIWIDTSATVESMTSVNVASKSYADTAGGLVRITPASVVNCTVSGTTVVFSAVNTFSLNGVFSSSYDWYRILISFTAASTSTELQMQMRLDGTTNGSNVYYSQQVNGNNGTGTFSRTRNAATNMQIGLGWTNESHISMDLFDPFLIRRTTYSANNNTSLGTIAQLLTGGHDIVSSYDGFTITTNNSAAVTGNMRIYGYKQ